MVEQGVYLDTHPAAGTRGRRFSNDDVSIQLEAGPSAAAIARNALVPIEPQVDATGAPQRELAARPARFPQR